MSTNEIVFVIGYALLLAAIIVVPPWWRYRRGGKLDRAHRDRCIAEFDQAVARMNRTFPSNRSAVDQ